MPPNPQRHGFYTDSLWSQGALLRLEIVGLNVIEEPGPFQPRAPHSLVRSADELCAFYVLDFIDQRSRVFIHDFYSARSPQQWTEKFNLEGLMRYYHIVGKIEELSPYVSGGLVVVLQKKTSAERREGAKLQRLSHRGDVYPMTI